jgi:hypothetical protein
MMGHARHGVCRIAGRGVGGGVGWGWGVGGKGGGGGGGGWRSAGFYRLGKRLALRKKIECQSTAP